jgi:DeoR/GlpR family transcriptional regulator of sugar metabolism
MGATGFSAAGVFSSQNILEAQLKQRALEVSERRVILADSSKFEHTAFSVFARADGVDVLITDRDFSGEENMRAAGIDVLIADYPAENSA